jgi:hypothetical protein
VVARLVTIDRTRPVRVRSTLRAHPVEVSRAQAVRDLRVRSVSLARLVTLVHEQVHLSERYDRTNEI